MKDTTRNEIWSALSETFESIRQTLQERVQGLTMEARHHQSDAFWFRAYAQYSAGKRVVVISFDIQARAEGLHVVGDISEEEGLVLKEAMSTTIGQTPSVDNDLIETAKRFAFACKKEEGILEKSLT